MKTNIFQRDHFLGEIFASLQKGRAKRICKARMLAPLETAKIDNNHKINLVCVNTVLFKNQWELQCLFNQFGFFV